MTPVQQGRSSIHDTRSAVDLGRLGPPGECGAGVLEVVDDFDGDTFRAVYTVKFRGFVYVLHAFQKKSKKGRETPKAEMDLIKERLKAAQADDESRTKEKTDAKK